MRDFQISRKLILPLLALALCLYPACKEEGEPFRENISSLSQFTKRFAPETLTQVIDNNAGGRILGPQGTVVDVPADAFVYENGAIVNGPVSIYLREIFTKGDMLGTGIFPMDTDDLPLWCGGQLYLGATRNGVPLKVNPSATVEVAFPLQDENRPGMQLFVADAPADADSLRWELQDTLEGVNQMGYSIDKQTVLMSLREIGWLNCDAFPEEEWEEWCIILEGEELPIFEELVYYFLLEGNSGSKRHMMAPMDTCVFPIPFPSLPLDFVAVGLHDGELYFGHQFFSGTPANTAVVSVKKGTSVELEALLEGIVQK